MRAALLVIAVLALIGFVAVSWILPGMAGTEAIEAAQALIAGADAAKQQVAVAAEKAGSLTGSGNGIKVEPRKDSKFGELKWIVEANGSVRGWSSNEKNPIEISLTPTLQGGKVSWACRGYPKVAMPASCG